MAAVPNRIAGVAYVTVDGRNYMLSGDLSYSASRVTRTTLVGQDGVHGFSEMPHAGFIAGTFRDVAGLKTADFNAMRSVTVVAQLANGKTVTGAGMWTVEAQEVKTAEATFDVRWEGLFVEEQ